MNSCMHRSWSRAPLRSTSQEYLPEVLPAERAKCPAVMHAAAGGGTGGGEAVLGKGNAGRAVDAAEREEMGGERSMVPVMAVVDMHSFAVCRGGSAMDGRAWMKAVEENAVREAVAWICSGVASPRQRSRSCQNTLVAIGVTFTTQPSHTPSRQTP